MLRHGGIKIKKPRLSAVYESGLPCRAKVKRYGGLVVILYMSIRLFKTLNIIREGFEEFFGVLWGKNDAAFDFAFGPTGHYTDEIHHELRHGMINYCKIRVGSFSRLLV